MDLPKFVNKGRRLYICEADVLVNELNLMSSHERSEPVGARVCLVVKLGNRNELALGKTHYGCHQQLATNLGKHLTFVSALLP